MKRTAGIWLAGFGLSLLCLPIAAVAAEAAEAPTSAEQPGTYVVKEGDTLWGIAKDLLNDPVLWPRLQEENPFITNPNRIYPGDRLAIPGQPAAPAPAPEAAQTAPPAPQAAAPVASAPAPEEEPAAPPEAAQASEPEAPEPAQTPEPAPAPASPEVKETSIPPVPPASAEAIACSPVLLPEQLKSAMGMGAIVQEARGRTLISGEDTVAVGLDPGRSVKVGDLLAVTRMGHLVADPRTGKSLGRVWQTLGVLKILEVREQVAKARVSHACLPMDVGDRVLPYTPSAFPEDKVAQPTSRSVEGTIVDSAQSEQLVALQQVVFLDVGTGQGIVPGDIFAIYRPSRPAANPVGGTLFPIPPVRLGEAVVIRVTPGTSTAVITSSPEVSQAGDRVVLSRAIQP